MLTLTPNDISLGARANNKSEAIAQIANQMVAAGLVENDYLKGMMDREQQTSTYLGNGIAIPHGTTETRNLVRETGLKVFRFPEGIEWGENQTVYTAIGIAAKSDEHLAILRQLTRVISDDALASRLHTTGSAEEVRSILTGETLAGEFLTLSELVKVKADVSSYAECVALAGALLWNHKAITQNDLMSLYAQTPFHLGEGVWLCTQFSESPCSGLSAILPRDVLPLYGQKLKLLLAISTAADRHFKLLDRLAELKAAGRLGELSDSKRANDLIRQLVAQDVDGERATCRIAMPHGLHARPAAQLARLAKGFKAEIWVENLDGDSAAVSALSLTKLIGLGAELGDRLQFIAQGEDASQALRELTVAVKNGLGDPIIALPENEKASPVASVSGAPDPVQNGEALTGLAGAPGVAIARAYQFSDPVYSFEKQRGPAAEQRERLEQAIGQVQNDLKGRLEKATNTDLAQIIGMHLELLIDPEMKHDADQRITQGDSAEWAWQQSFEALASLQEQSSRLLLAERAIDIRDVGNRVLGELTGQSSAQGREEEHVLICQEIAPSEISELDTTRVKAVVSAAGGVTSHAAILARSLGIPLLVGCGPRVLTIADGTDVIVDCESRTLQVGPDGDKLQAAREAIERDRVLNEQAHAARLKPAVTTDGHHVEIMANLTAAKAVDKAVEMGCEGVGLFRSEFIYMDYPQEPSIEQQQAEYERVLEGLGDRPLIVRTLDVGGDKPLPYLPMDEEENPFLGVRGVRLSLRYPQILKNQLHALLRAAAGRPLRIMFPMVTDILEWRQIRALFREVSADYPDARVELGIMIEVPSAAILASVFASELDFFSVGTNDLTQYTLAIDRGHPELSRQADPISPAVLRLIQMTVRAADEAGIWVGVCGELAGDPLGATILTGLGVRELSMSVRSIPRVKAHLRDQSLAEARKLAQQALSAESSEAVRALPQQVN